MKRYNALLTVIITATVATSCGNPTNARKVIGEQTSDVEGLESGTVLAPSSLSYTQQNQILSNHISANGSQFNGNIVDSSGQKGAAVTLKFLNASNSSYTYADLKMGTNNHYQGIYLGTSASITFNYINIALSENQNCLIINDSLNNLTANVCSI